MCVCIHVCVCVHLDRCVCFHTSVVILTDHLCRQTTMKCYAVCLFLHSGPFVLNSGPIFR